MGSPIIHEQRNFWAICRRFSELGLSRRFSLLQWAERGRLLSGDYVFDADLDTWICAREQAELKMFFQNQKARRARRAIALLLAVAVVSLFISPLSSTVFVISAGAIFIRQHRLERSAARNGASSATMCEQR